MIRALQMRVNRRTKTYSRLVDEGEQASNAELVAVQQLAQREKKIRRITRDLGMGKTQ